MRMEIEAAKELMNSSLWREVEKEVDFRVSCLMNTLMSCPPEELEATRIRIRALKELKAIPKSVIERET